MLVVLPVLLHELTSIGAPETPLGLATTRQGVRSGRQALGLGHHPAGSRHPIPAVPAVMLAPATASRLQTNLGGSTDSEMRATQG